jgi:hypothetical protein
VAQHEHPVVFMLWGAHAQTKKPLIDACMAHRQHLVLQANHPSPLSALRPPRPFLGCGHFQQAAQFWTLHKEKEVQWVEEFTRYIEKEANKYNFKVLDLGNQRDYLDEIKKIIR